jgi:tetratricopeptide (TPR) repeat protein
MRRASPYSAVFASRTAFVGRELERARLLQSLNSSWQGRGVLTLIAGEAGVGKTRLALEIALQAELSRAVVAVGHCREAESAFAYLPFIEIIESLCAAQASVEELGEIVGADGPELARLYPQLRRRLPDLGPPIELPAEQQQRFLFNSVCDFLERLAERHGLLLVLEDLQRADVPTLRLLAHLAARLPAMRACILCTCRDHELDASSAGAELLERFVRERLAQTMTLAGFSPAGVTSMLRALSGQEPSPQLIDQIYRETEGNPFFVEEVFHYLSEEGRLFDREGRLRRALKITELDVAPSVRLTIGRRLKHLDRRGREVLAIAATIGRSFSFEFLSALSDIKPDVLLGIIEELLRARLLAPSAESDASFGFAHELIRQTVLVGLSAPRRQRLHLLVADKIERLTSGTPDENSAEIAEHLCKAGALVDPATAIPHLIRAGERALEACAFEDALRHYERALSLNPADDSVKAEVHYKLGLAQRSLGRWDDALRSWEQALTIFEVSGDVDAAGKICGALTSQLSWTGRWADSIKMASRGLALLGDRISADRSRMLIANGATLSLAGHREAGVAMINQALVIADELGDARLKGVALYGKAIDCYAYMRPREMLEVCIQAKEHLSDSTDGWLLTDCAIFYVSALFALGRFDDVAKACAEVGPLADRLGNVPAVVSLDRDRNSARLISKGTIGEWLDSARRDLEACNRIRNPALSAGALSFLGVAEMWRGNWDDAMAHFKEGAAREPAGPLGGNWVLVALGNAYDGRNEEALAMLDRRRGEFAELHQQNSASAWMVMLTGVEVFFLAGERQAAADLYPLVIGAIRTGQLYRPYDYRLLETVAGIAATAARNWDSAERHFSEALRIAEELPHRIEQPEVRRFHAQMLIERGSSGDKDRARALLQEAIRAYRQLAMPRHRKIAEGLLRTLRTDRRDSTEPINSDVFRRDGDTWFISWSGKQTRLRNLKGLGHLARLLQNPGMEFTALELAGTNDTNAAVCTVSALPLSAGADVPLRISNDLGDAGAMLDSSAKSAYHKRLKELRADLDESERLNDLGAMAGARSEIEAITAELSRAIGLGARDRKAVSHVERARASTTLSIRTAISAISRLHPELGRHLDATIRTGKVCTYHRDSGTALAWLT